MNVEPRETARLDRGNSVFHNWKAQRIFFIPSNTMTWIASLPYPNAVELPDDVHDHVRCRFRIHGDDKWFKDNIAAYVKYVHREGVPGTIDSFIWVEDINWTHVGNFTQEVEFSTDPGGPPDFDGDGSAGMTFSLFSPTGGRVRRREALGTRH